MHVCYQVIRVCIVLGPKSWTIPSKLGCGSSPRSRETLFILEYSHVHRYVCARAHVKWHACAPAPGRVCALQGAHDRYAHFRRISRRIGEMLPRARIRPGAERHAHHVTCVWVSKAISCVLHVTGCLYLFSIPFYSRASPATYLRPYYQFMDLLNMHTTVTSDNVRASGPADTFRISYL